MSAIEILTISLGGIAILKFVVDIVNKVKTPDIKQDLEIVGMKKDVEVLQADLTIIKVNHLAHIETDIRDMSERMAKVETILDERLPNKIKKNLL